MITDQRCPNCFCMTMGANPCPVCAYDRIHPNSIPQVLLPGTSLFNRYIVGKTIGHGGFGITYLAYDLSNNQIIAIKEYFPIGLVIRQGLSVVPFGTDSKDVFAKGSDNFYREASILAQFNTNPNIVQIQNFFRENNSAYIVMEYIDGQSLMDYLRYRGGHISLVETEQILFPIMDALSAIHQGGLIHRDIAPDNIYLTKSGVPKLLDFGAARFEMNMMTMSGNTVIKPGFAPIEQYTGTGMQGPWTDVYAMGATFYHALTGIIPIPSPDRAMGQSLHLPHDLGIQIPEYTENALMTSLAVNPDERFHSMIDFKNSLISSTPNQFPAMQSAQIISSPQSYSANVSSQFDSMHNSQTAHDNSNMTQKTSKKSSFLRVIIIILSLIILALFLNSARESRSQLSVKQTEIASYILIPMQELTPTPLE